MNDVCSTSPVYIHAIDPSTTKPSKRQLMDLTRDLSLLSKFLNLRVTQLITLFMLIQTGSPKFSQPPLLLV